MDQTEVRITQSPPRLFQPTIRSHLAFTALSALVLLVMFSLLRLALLIYNRELIGATPASTFLGRSATACVSTCGSSSMPWRRWYCRCSRYARWPLAACSVHG